MSNSSPAYDNKIARKYSMRTLEHKLDNKTALQEELGWIHEPKQPIICLPGGMTDALGGELLEEMIDGLLELPVGIVVRGRGERKYGEMFAGLSQKFGYKLKIVQDNDTQCRRMLAGSDMALYCALPADLGEMEDVLRYGVIPVAPAMPLLDNYNPVQESGNAFVYDKPTKWVAFASVVRALETFRFPYDWKTIQRYAMESVHETAEVEG